MYIEPTDVTNFPDPVEDNDNENWYFSYLVTLCYSKIAGYLHFLIKGSWFVNFKLSEIITVAIA